jgi:arsenical pump membrane protein
MIPVDIAAIAATLVMLHLFFRKEIPPEYDLAKLQEPARAIHDLPTFRTGWIVLLLLLVGFFVLEPLGIPVSAIATVGALILFAVAKRGHAINTGKCCAARRGRSSSSRWGCIWWCMACVMPG